jgi:hypothetical protein
VVKPSVQSASSARFLTKPKKKSRLFLAKEINLGARNTETNTPAADLFVTVHHDSMNDKYLGIQIADVRKLNYWNPSVCASLDFILISSSIRLYR